MKTYNIEQGTQEWLDLRKGKMTASHAQAISANGKGLGTYILELMAEYYSIAEKEHYTNEHIERGNELEGCARGIYELEYDIEVQEVGFVELDQYVGCSPDGLVGEDGLIEIKCPSDKKHFNFILNDKIDSAYVWQMQMQMLVTGRQWCDFVSFNPNYKDSIVTQRVERDEPALEKLKLGLETGKEKIENIKYKIK